MTSYIPSHNKVFKLLVAQVVTDSKSLYERSGTWEKLDV